MALAHASLLFVLDERNVLVEPLYWVSLAFSRHLDTGVFSH